MRRLLITLFAIITVISCGKINEQFENINARLDNLENTTIASINQQIASINTSIGNLESTDRELKGYITNLQNSATELQRSLNTTNEKIDRIEGELRADISSTEEVLSGDILAAKTELLAELGTLRTDTQGKIDLINTAISNLQTADVNLGKRIDDLKTYTDKEIKDAKDWATATFSTLEQYNQTVEEIAGIKADISSINTAMTELETRLNTKIATDISTAVSTLEGELQQQAEDITQAYKEAITKAKGEIESAYTTAIANAITSSESSMRAWVNECLTGYYTIAETDAKLLALQQNLEGQLGSQKTYLEGLLTGLESSLNDKITENASDIEELRGLIATCNRLIEENANSISDNAADIAQLRTDLNTARSEITAAYQQAIATAINTLDGQLRGKITIEIETINNRIDREIQTINNTIETLTGRVATCETEIAGIKSSMATLIQTVGSIQDQIQQLIQMVQSIIVIPDYSDGSVKCTKGFNEFSFEVLPSGLAASLAAMGTNIFTLKAVYTQTKSSHTFVTFPINNVSTDGDILIVTASAENINEEVFTKNISANACLTINSGVNSYSTGYFPLTAIPSEGGGMEAIDLGLSVKWASCNLGASSPEEYGDYYAWGETATKSDYSWSTYKWCNGSSTTLTKYCTNSSYGTIDNITELQRGEKSGDTIDDAARSILGGEWRMPTIEELEELINNTNNAWTTYNGVNGYKFTSKTNSANWIFMPAAGYWDSPRLRVAGSLGYYWSSLLHPGRTERAMTVSFSVGQFVTVSQERYLGISIRPVCEE